MEDDQLLDEQCILGNELGFTARQVRGHVQHQGRMSGLGEMAEGLIEKRTKAGEEVPGRLRREAMWMSAPHKDVQNSEEIVCGAPS